MILKRTKGLALLCVLISAFGTTYAQVEKLYKAEWSAAPVKYTLTAEELKEPQVILKKEQIIEMIYDGDGERLEYFTIHKHVHVNEQKAVEQYNKIYLPVKDKDRLYYFNARTISKSGKIANLSKADMKEIEEDGQRYLILAVSGLEKDGELEYMYTVQRNDGLWGSISLQSEEIARNITVRLITPKNLVLESKSYNGFPALKDTLIDEKNYLVATADRVAPSNDEKYCNYGNDLMRVEYKVARNYAGDGARLLTYVDAGKLFYKSYTAMEKDEEKAADKLFSKLKLSKLDDENKIRTIENYLKTTVNYEERAGNNVAELLEKNYGNQTALTKLYFSLFKKAGVKFEIVLASNRYEKTFDPDFDSWVYLDNVLFYFPQYDKYVSVADYSYRYGIVQHHYAGCDALFIKEMSIGSINSGISQVKKIKEADVAASHDNMDITVDFDAGLASATMHVKRSFAGHSAVGLRPAYFYSNESDRKEIDKTILNMDLDDAKIVESKASNYNLGTDEAEKEFIGEGKVTFTSLMEKAGDAILFKVGGLIGKQVEMYQEKPREHNIDVTFPHTYTRKLKIKVPDGYVAKGLDVLKINIGNADAGFTSEYVLNGNTIEIEVKETYGKTFYPKSEFEPYKKVVNAAADFNKLSILLEKK